MSIGTVLVSGATGFIGRRLVPALLADNVRVRTLSRNAGHSFPADVEQATGDLLQRQSLDGPLAGVDVAYYLVHSMGEEKSFSDTEARAATHFAEAAEQAGVRRVIYLSGLGESGAGLSEHLQSRQQVAEILRSGRFQTTVLRSGVIIGAGGSSYEMIRFLVRTMPVLPEHHWLQARCQPIAVDDVIRYLVGCLYEERTGGDTFDIGGPEVMTYYEMLERFAAVLGSTHLAAPVPPLLPRAIARWIGLVTPVKTGLAQALISGVQNDVVCNDTRIRELLPFELTGFEEAVCRALHERRDARQQR